MSDTTVKDEIISSLNNRSLTHSSPPEDYVSHIKIWEENLPTNGQAPAEEGALKPRYILLTSERRGTLTVLSRWEDMEARRVEGVEVLGPRGVAITMPEPIAGKPKMNENRKLSLNLSYNYFIGPGASTRETRVPSPTPPSLAASESAQSFNTVGSIPRRGVLRPPSISSLGTSVDTRSRAGSISGSFRREKERDPEPEPQPPTPRVPKQRPTPNHMLLTLRDPVQGLQRPPLIQSSRSVPTRNSERSSQANSERERVSQAERERVSQTDSRPPQPSIVIPPTLQDGIPSPRTRTPIRGSPAQYQNTPLSRIASKATVRPPSPDAVPSPTVAQPPRRDPNARISYFDPTNQAVLERLLQQGADGDVGESALSNVEDMLDGFEWRLKSGASGGIYCTLILKQANIHSFVESDDRLALVLKFIDDALNELNDMDSMISSYKAVGDDISYIQSQNRGLQVQTQNQKVLLNEIEKLLQTVHVDRDALLVLTQESLENQRGIQRLEDAAAQLYRALLAGRDRDMSATIERLAEYKTYNQQFCVRIVEFLGVMFGYQRSPRKEIRALFMKYIELVQRAPEEDGDNSFAPPPQQSAVSRAGGLFDVLGQLYLGHPWTKRTHRNWLKEILPVMKQAFDHVLSQVIVQIHAEDAFISRFLHTTDSTLSYADYMNLDNYFKRQASRGLGLSDTTLKLVRGAMDLIFGFLPQEIKSWVEGVSKRDSLQLVGIIAVLQRYVAEAQERNDAFVDRLLGKPLQRLNGLYQRQVEEHLQAIEQTKLTTKKRNGVAHFIRYFPTFVGRIEAQLVGAQGYEIRKIVDAAYERIVQAMFEALQQMAKMDGTEAKDPDDKGVLNYHVIMIAFVTRAEETYHRELSAYVTFVLRRPMAKIIDYFDGVERLLQTTAPSEISNNSNFSRSALKKVVKEYDSKDMRKNVDGLYKRVEKHFDAEEGSTIPAGHNGAAAPVLVGVWNACEEQLLRLTDRWIRLIGQCYPDSGVSLEYTTGDVRAAFRKHRAG
ncbi:Exocyst complex component SEC3 N-terminal PIP2 binding PH [Rhizoctonia solani]|uniref:Exocyst complex component SEC3 N-terminal PIP2 binding PH n=1 Tax=Rhizoctonia solani TaxID=456999 RepID=A0A8H7IF68_9AGAM|nr:Exocyst complex component SEC3 N-terminal PIP2 binding PH [Rhizoctonia solani]